VTEQLPTSASGSFSATCAGDIRFNGTRTCRLRHYAHRYRRARRGHDSRALFGRHLPGQSQWSGEFEEELNGIRNKPFPCPFFPFPFSIRGLSEVRPRFWLRRTRTTAERIRGVR
jgi:hypothetical protein